MLGEAAAAIMLGPKEIHEEPLSWVSKRNVFMFGTGTHHGFSESSIQQSSTKRLYSLEPYL